MKRCILLLIASLLCGVAVAQTPQYQVRYWFDTDLAGSVSHTLSGGTLHADIQTDALSVGVHSLHVMLLDTNGQWKSLQTHLFFRIADNSEVQAARYHYWFDDDFDNHQSGNVTSGGILLDASGLSAGIHEVHIIAEDGTGRLHSPQTALFYRAPVQNMTNVPYLCWFDNDFQNRTSGTANGNITINTGSLSDGIHTVNLRIGTDENATLQSHLFYKTHTPQITKYEYWFNDQTDDDHIVVATNVEDTLTLERLIQAPAFPIRSTYFQYTPDTASSRPYVNAKNDFHFRTTNTTGRYSDRTHTYFDATVVDSVYADTLERNTTRTVRAPYNDTIRWFMVTAGVGDSLAFTASKRCTMQLFSPSGKEVMKKTGSNVLSWNGLMSLESGNYYLAVHDAEESEGNVDISYNWVYKYAILDWNVRRVGNGGISSIDFIGNGFKSLDTVFLIHNLDTLYALHLNRKGNTELAAAFNFEDADTGMYRAVFRYVDENWFKDNLVTVEEPREIIIDRQMSYTHTFHVGSPAEYTYRITNTGNMTAYNVPVQINIVTEDEKTISRIDIEGVDVPSFMDGWNVDEISQSSEAILTEVYGDDLPDYMIGWDMRQSAEEYIAEFSKSMSDMDDSYLFINGWHYDTINNDSSYLQFTFLFVTLAPYETINIKLSISTIEPVTVWMQAADSIPTVTMETFTGDLSNAKIDWGLLKCCLMQTSKCVFSIVGSTTFVQSLLLSILQKLGFKGTAVPAGALGTVSCISNAISTINAVLFKNNCRHEEVPSYWDILSELKWNLTGTISGCLAKLGSELKAEADALKAAGQDPKKLGGLFTLGNALLSAKTLKAVIQSAISGIEGLFKTTCWEEIFSFENDCSDDPPPGGPAYPVVPYDPNDIIGYTAESGSHYVGKQQIELPYIIEFENDPQFASAPAHTVVVTDTLDSRHFDLSSFSATGFGIGNELYTIEGGKEFIKTVDLRPTLDVLSEVRLRYNEHNGVALWTFRSLDPITLEEITDPNLGFLPVNNSNNIGVGEVIFTINRKDNLNEGDTISNRATILFDVMPPIATPIWNNILDLTPPTSEVDTVSLGAATAKLSINAEDNLSGTWRYNVYGVLGESFMPLAMNIPIDSVVTFPVNVEYDGFRTAAIDSAGNIEQVLPPAPTVNKEETLTGCDSIVWRDSIYTATGDYTRTFEGQRTGDADTVVTLHLTVYNVEHTATVDTACDSYTWNGTVYTQSGLYTFSHDDANGCTQVDTLHLVVFNGFQINVAAGTWNAIASPVLSNGSTESVEWVENLIDGTYDLFRYNEAEGKWENYKSHHFDLERGRGYIYRRSDALTLKFKGIPNNGNFSGHSVTRSCADATLKGFNLVGNPYPHAIRKGQAFATTSDTLVTGWYELRPNGIWYAHTDADPIAIGQAVLVKTKDNLNGATGLRFSDITPGGKGSYLSSPTISFTVSGNGVSDIAYAILAEGSSLPKFGHLAEEAPMLSIPVENGSYAIASLGANCKQFDLAFRGRPGNYTISLHDIQAGVAYSSEPRNGSEQPSYFDYVHLIDLATGLDIDLLSQPDYNFTHTDGQTPANRFLVKLWPDSAAPSKSPFAYQSGNNIVVCGQGTLYVYDILGRQLFSKEMTAFNSQIPVSTFPYTGVYVLRLGEQTQKIVVRQ